MATETIINRLIQNSKTLASKPAVYRKVNGAWTSLTWKEYADLVQRTGRAFMALGFQPGQVVTILSNNRLEWVTSDLAAMAAGGVATGIYQTCTDEQVAYIVRHAESPICVVENADQLDKLRARRSELPALKWVVLLDGSVPETERQWVLHWDDLLKKAEAVPAQAFDDRVADLQPDALATLIYTSGTTGDPKGVMLSHRNLTWTADSLKEISPTDVDHAGVSYLPLSHIAEQMLSLHLAITMGSAIWFAESIEKLKENLVDARPTIFFGVPRVWEKFEAVLAGRFKEATGFKATMLAFSRNTATEVNKVREQGHTPSGLLALKYAIANKLVLSKLKRALGFDRCLHFVSGAAPISRSTLEFFQSIDIVIKEVYGQSEDCGPTSMNRIDRWKLGTVGPAIPGVEIKIAEDGEILVKGGNVFLGYYKNPDATAETLVNGWLCSGDVGEVDPQGFLRITDRKKDLIITAGGKNVSPQNLEKLLKGIPEVAQAVVIGDRRKYLTALLTLEPEASKRWATANGVALIGLEALAHDKKFREYIHSQIEQINGKLAQYETIKQFSLLASDFSLETGELTPSLKIKRKVVNERYKDAIEQMYR